MHSKISLMVKGSFPSETLVWETESAMDRIAPRLSEGWPHSAASQVSL